MDFLRQGYCDRCGNSLKDGRITSMYNTETICTKCKEEELKRPDYKLACDAVQEEEKKGNYNFKGIGFECPICHNRFPRLLALSRTDNKTMICDSCGTNQALEDYWRNLK